MIHLSFFFSFDVIRYGVPNIVDLNSVFTLFFILSWCVQTADEESSTTETLLRPTPRHIETASKVACLRM